jgi:hypothetical protein
MLFFTGCISPFEPDMEGENGLLVVDGSIIKGRETQVIIISRTAPITQPEYLPVEDCHVRIMDNAGNEFVFNEESPGKYVANIEDAWLNYDKQYKLVFTTSSGDDYESTYQWLLETDPVDSLYGIIEYHYSSYTGEESTKGVQFYVDLDAPETASRYYRWVLEETWEERLTEEIWGVYDGVTIKPFYPSDSLQRCWETRAVTGLYSASTINLSANRIKKIPLHFVVHFSPMLEIKYCATIKQYALNADAYDYWYEKERELTESGNIYSIQPSQPKSNIHNTNNPEEQVLGFFWAASFTVERVFVIPPPKAPEENSCSGYGFYSESSNFNVVAALMYPVLLANPLYFPVPPVYISRKLGTQYTIPMSPLCIDCRTLGGVVEKPDFWE